MIIERGGGFAIVKRRGKFAVCSEDIAEALDASEYPYRIVPEHQWIDKANAEAKVESARWGLEKKGQMSQKTSICLSKEEKIVALRHERSQSEQIRLDMLTVSALEMMLKSGLGDLPLVDALKLATETAERRLG